MEKPKQAVKRQKVQQEEVQKQKASSDATELKEADLAKVAGGLKWDYSQGPSPCSGGGGRFGRCF